MTRRRARGAVVAGRWTARLVLASACAWASSALAAGPVGSLVVDCTGIEGWAQEPDMPDALIDVHLYFNGPAGDPAASAVVVTANLGVDEGCMGARCMHGYRSALPMSLLDASEHEVHAYGIDLTGDPNLEIGAGSMSCPPPPIVGGELRHVVSPEILGAWQFSVFFDRLVVADETIAGLVQGPVLDVGPQLRIDGGGGLWLVDQGFRRLVAVGVEAAWRLDPTLAVPLAAEELALPEGGPLRPRPVLVQGTMLEVYLLDDHQCGAGDPDPSCAPEPSDDTGPDPSGEGSSDGEGSEVTSEDGAGEGTEGSGTGMGVLTGLSPAKDDDAGGCACRAKRGGSAWGLLPLLGAFVRRRRARA